MNECFSIDSDGNLEFIENFQCLFLRQFEAFGNDTRMETLGRHKEHNSVDRAFASLSLSYLGDVEIGLLEKFTNDQHNRGRSITGDIILRRCRTSDQRGCWMLNLLDERETDEQ